MSVQTTADDRRDEAKDHIEQAQKCLMSAIDIDTWGSDQFNKDYVAKMEEAILGLIKMKRDL